MRLSSMVNIRIPISLVPVTGNGEDPEVQQKTYTGGEKELILLWDCHQNWKGGQEATAPKRENGCVGGWIAGSVKKGHYSPLTVGQEASTVHHLYIRSDWFSTRVSFIELCQLLVAAYTQSSGWVCCWPAGAQNQMALLGFRHGKWLSAYSFFSRSEKMFLNFNTLVVSSSHLRDMTAGKWHTY